MALSRSEISRRYYARHSDRVKASQRRYRERHPDRVKAARKRSKAKYKAKYAERQRRWYLEHAEERRAISRTYSKTYRAAHLEECRARGRKYMRTYIHLHKHERLAYQRKWTQRNKERLREYYRTRRRRFKEYILNQYGGRCACCGETHLEFLCIDHIGGGGNKHRKHLAKTIRQSLAHGGVPFYRWLKHNRFPLGFRVLCHNCNQALGHYNYCPHRVL